MEPPDPRRDGAPAPGRSDDAIEQPERRLTVDDYESQVHGAGSRTQADVGGAAPSDAPGERDPRDDLPDAEPGST